MQCCKKLGFITKLWKYMSKKLKPIIYIKKLNEGKKVGYQYYSMKKLASFFLAYLSLDNEMISGFNIIFYILLIII